MTYNHFTSSKNYINIHYSWHRGKTVIPIEFLNGFAIAVNSNQEILLIGSSSYLVEDRILSFNVIDHTFNELPSVLNVGRFAHTCAFIPTTNKIIELHYSKGIPQIN